MITTIILTAVCLISALNCYLIFNILKYVNPKNRKVFSSRRNKELKKENQRLREKSTRLEKKLFEIQCGNNAHTKYLALLAKNNS